MRLQQALSGIPDIDPGAARISPLQGGITNSNFRVDLDEQVLVVRLGGQNTDLLGIDRGVEVDVTAWAARAGIGADLVVADPGADFLVTRFIDGTTLTAEACDAEVVAEVARLIRSVHGGATVNHHFSPFTVARRYLAQAQERGVKFSNDLEVALQRTDVLEEALPSGHFCLCHNDLLGANFLHDGRSWRLIDWEYAAMGDPFFDLGNFAVNQNLDDSGCEVLLRSYFGQVTPRDLAHLGLMRAASDLREACWGFLQSALSDIDFDFYGYGSRHLTRFLESSQGPGFSRYLTEVRGASRQPQGTR